MKHIFSSVTWESPQARMIPQTWILDEFCYYWVSSEKNHSVEHGKHQRLQVHNDHLPIQVLVLYVTHKELQFDQHTPASSPQWSSDSHSVWYFMELEMLPLDDKQVSCPDKWLEVEGVFQLSPQWGALWFPSCPLFLLRPLAYYLASPLSLTGTILELVWSKLSTRA